MKTATVLANLLVLLIFVLAALLHEFDPTLYYRSVQEDEYLEWATFWGFIAGTYYYSANALQQYRQAGTFAWFVLGLAVFCLLVALEEISWGQRLLSYRAPDYFLEQNYQQEFNIHNVVDTRYRKLVMQLVLLGYGVILSTLSLVPPVKRFLQRLRIVAPPANLIVSFLAMSLVYAWYPWGHTGEWVELTMALGFVFAAVLGRAPGEAYERGPQTRQVLLPVIVILTLTVLTVSVVRHGRSADPEKVQAARLEIDALSADFDSGQIHTRCGIHKRLYTFMQEYGQPYFLQGNYAQLTRASGAAERGEYLLDPWNAAYWVRHKCSDGKLVLFLYSFGPNQRRDSTDWEIAGDDVGAYLIKKP